MVRQILTWLSIVILIICSIAILFPRGEEIERVRPAIVTYFCGKTVEAEEYVDWSRRFLRLEVVISWVSPANGCSCELCNKEDKRLREEAYANRQEGESWGYGSPSFLASGTYSIVDNRIPLQSDGEVDRDKSGDRLTAIMQKGRWRIKCGDV